MDNSLDLTKEVSDLERSFKAACEVLQNYQLNTENANSLKQIIENSKAALKAICNLKQHTTSNKEEVVIDEFSDHEQFPSDDDWDCNAEDFDDMVKACEEAEISHNSIEDGSDSPNENEDSFTSHNGESNCTNVESVKPSEEEEFDCEPPKEEHFRILRQFFGHASFRPMQWKIIQTVLVEHKDVSAVMATGYGKSLCYQYPAVYTNKPVIVVSPLISLMEDQVMALNVANIGACYLGSSQNNMGKVKEELLQGIHKVIYLTPEFAEGALQLLQTLDKRIGIVLFAIDEAHCVSHWGHDFRNSYRHLGNLRKNFSHVPFMAVTATATPAVLNDICSSLHLKNPIRVCSNFDRPNLFLEVCLKSGSVENDLLRVMTKKNGKPGFSGPTIIYCPTRNATEDVFKKLNGMKVSCQMYHAGMTPLQRKTAHREFVHDKVEVVVATVAFGMGIDKPDVRRVIHYGAPKDIESYYQEIGRAGRDGSPSVCQVFYANGDFVTSKFFLKEIKNEKFFAHKSDMISKMQQYLNSTKCRRQMLLSHFQGEEVKCTGQTEKCCDNCKKRLKRNQQSAKNGGSSQQSQDDRKDFAEEAKLLFGAIESTGGSFGLQIPIYILRGSSNQKVTEQMKRCPTYGKGKHIAENWWKAFGRLLMCEKYLQEKRIGSYGKQSFGGCTVGITAKAKIWLEQAKRTPSHPLVLEMNAEMVNFEEAKAYAAERKITIAAAPPKTILTIPTETGNGESQAIKELFEEAPVEVEEPLDPHEEKLKGELYKQVFALRNSIADTESLAPYMVFSNKNLLDIAVYRPVSMETLSQIEGITTAKISKFGKSIIKLVANFCRENGLKEDAFQKSKPPEVKEEYNPVIKTLSPTVQESYNQYKKCKDVNAVASQRGLAVITVYNHLIEAFKGGLPLKMIDLGVTKEIFDTIANVIRSPPINSDVSRLSPIKQRCPDYIEFIHIKAVIAVLETQYGINETTVGVDKGSSQIKEEDVSNCSSYSSNAHERSKANTIEENSSSKRKENSLAAEPPTIKKMKSNKLFKL
ncbi:hypothetical protein JTE90_005982 [Oedothorax gibbosus]|uniref:DNA 3'-5' helicase n=1 Tax=Oedothorax gibbosus TaxID=931172 RepID=A0AAV6UWY5_9ARAC|nr:hypothetical protein JTE90_005982 [Oedothorax gibbosus]